MKDPAFLFYSSDFLSGTMLMTDEEIGQYIKLICLQHQKGHLKEKDMLNICKTYNEDIFSKFKKDEEGNYYNERLESEVNRRKAYSESRRNNRKKKDVEGQTEETYVEDMKNICNSYEEHMETEATTITEDINNNLNKENEENLQKEFIKCLNSYNEIAISECLDFLKLLPFDVIKDVLKRTSRIRSPNWAYAKTILDDYVKKNIDTLEKIKVEQDNFKNSTKKDIEKKGYSNYEQRQYCEGELEKFYANSATGGVCN